MSIDYRKYAIVRVALAAVLIAGIFHIRPVQAETINFGWAKSVGGTARDRGDSIALDASGNVYTTGTFMGTVDFDPGPETYHLTASGSDTEIFISKLDSNGNFVWAKNVDRTSPEGAVVTIAVDSDSNAYIVSHFSGTIDFDPGPNVYSLTSAGKSDIFLSKLDSNGNFIWAKSMGGASYDWGFDMALDSSGNVYTVGTFAGIADFDPSTGIYNLTCAGQYAIFLSKLDSAGNFVWAKSMCGPDQGYGNSIALDASRNVYATGSFSNTVDFDPGTGVYNLTSHGLNDIFVSKLDSNGNFVWARSMGGTNSDVSQGTEIAVDVNHNVYTTGDFENTVDFDPGPGIYNLTSLEFGNNIFVSKLDSNGSFVWAKSISGVMFLNSFGIVVDISGNVYTTGLFEDTVDLDPGTGISNLTSAGGADIFFSKLDSNGNLAWAKRLGGTGWDSSGDLVMDSSHNIYITGLFELTVDFDPGTGANNLTSAGDFDSFITKLATVPQIYYVKQDATGANNGTSWEDAYADLQSALSAASSGDEIWVAAGTYKPTSGTDRTISFNLKNGVVVYGGFAGTETSRAQRDYEANLTILSGDIGVVGDNSDNAYHVVSSEATNATTVLNGFTVTAGNANGSSPYDDGGGIYNDSSSPTLTNVTFSGNIASSVGGGMYNYQSNPTLTNVTFSGNTALAGGGMFNHDSSPTLTNVTFDGNTAMSDTQETAGGGMYNFDSSQTLTNVTFSGNAATRGGGMYNHLNSPTLMNVTFSGNTAIFGGGGMFNHDSSPTLINTLIANSVSGGDCDYVASPLNLASSNNLIEGPDACGLMDGVNGNVIGKDPKLGALADNVGATQTHALLSGSPAIDAGRNTGCPDTDQRGVTRPQGSHCDIGAYEAAPISVDVNIGTLEVDSHLITSNITQRKSYPGVNNGPVKITNTDNSSLVASERVIYKINGVNTSFSEMMGLPAIQLDNTYWLPWYNNVDLDTQLRFANVTDQPATVTVTIGGVVQAPINLAAGESTRKSFSGINNGPVQIVSDQNIVAAERVIYKAKGVNTSFSEMMALPNSQLDKTYWLPWYNNVDLDTQLRIANVSNSQAMVTVTIGGIPQPSFNLAAGESIRKSFAGVNNGPVKIESSHNIVAAERVIYKVNGINTSFSEMMALPDGQLDTAFWFPWYNNLDLDTQLRFANTTNTLATVHVYVGDTEMQGSPFTLAPGESTRKSFPSINSGPVKIVSDVPIAAAERVIYKVNGINTSFSEMMGLPNNLLDATFWFPWYNNVDLDTQLRFGVP